MKRIFTLFVAFVLIFTCLVPVGAKGMEIGVLGNETINLVGNTAFLTMKDAFWYSENGQIFCDETPMAEGEAACLNLLGDALYFIDADTSVKKLENGKISVLYTGEDLSCFYASSLGKGWFLENGTIYAIDLTTCETSVAKAMGGAIQSFIPTEYGFVYAVGAWSDYNVYLEEELLKTGVFSYYREGNYLVFSCDGEEDSQIAFADIIRGMENFEEVSLYGGNVEMRELLAAMDTTTDLEANGTPYGEVTEDAVYEVTGETTVRTLSVGQDNIVKNARQMHEIEWTCLKQRTGWSGTFYAGTTYRGIPYGQPYSSGTYVPHNVSFATFKAATADINSAFYTRYGAGANTTHPYYSNDCSAFVSYAWNLHRITTAGYGSSGNGYATQHGKSVQSLQVGDAINSPSNAGVGHIILITNVYYSGSTVVGVETTEQTPPKTTRRYYGSGAGAYASLSSLQSKMNNGPYYILRKKNRDAVTYTHDCATPIDGDYCSACNPTNFIYSIDVPAQGSVVAGDEFSVGGWVIHKSGVASIEVLINERDTFSVDRWTREDVAGSYPDYPGTDQGYDVSFETADFPLGTASCSLVVVAGDGEEDVIGNRIFTISGTRKPKATMKMNGHIYDLYDNGYSRAEAEKFASDNAGFLMTIESDAEAKIALALMEKGGKDGYWLGGTKGSDSYKWSQTSLTVEPVEGMDWAEDAGTENYMYLAKDGSWHTCDGDIGVGIGFIVERFDTCAVASVVHNGYVYSLYDEPYKQSDAVIMASSLCASLVEQNTEVLSYLTEKLLPMGKMESYWLESTNVLHQDGSVTSKDSGINTGFITKVSASASAANATTYGNSTFWRVDDSRTWYDAEAIAESLGGHLAIFETTAEQSAVAGILSGGAFDAYWVGGNDNFTEGEYIWVNGTNFTESHSDLFWYENEPNDYRNNEDFLQVYRDYNGAMNDGTIHVNTAELSQKLSCGYIIEFDEPKVPETVYVFKDVIYAQYSGGGAWSGANDRAQKTGGVLPSPETQSEKYKLNHMAGGKVWLYEESEGTEEYPVLSGVTEITQEGKEFANYTIAYRMDYKVLDTVEVGGKTFVFYDGGVPHTIADAFCKNIGGKLANIETADELSGLQAKAASLGKNGYFIGGGNALTYTNINTNAKNVIYPVLKKDGTATKTFYTTQNISDYGFICELTEKEVSFVTDSYIEEDEQTKKFTAAYRISSSLAKDADAVVFAAVFDQDGRMTALTQNPGTVSACGVLAGEISATLGDEDVLRLMAFDSVSGLKPWTEALVPELSDYTAVPLPSAGNYTLRNVATGAYLTVSEYADMEGLALTTRAQDHAMFQTFKVMKAEDNYRFTPYSASFGTGRAMSGTSGTPTLTSGGTSYTLTWDNGFIRVTDPSGAYALTDNGALVFAATSDTDSQRWIMQEVSAPKKQSATTTGNLNVRAGAGTNYESLGVFAAGADVTTMGEPSNTKWYCVYGMTEQGNYVYGFASNAYLSVN